APALAVRARPASRVPRAPTVSRARAQVQHVHRPLARAQSGEAVLDGSRGRLRGPSGRVLEGEAARKQGGKRRRGGAAGAVGGCNLVARHVYLQMALAVEEVIDGVAAVTPSDDHRVSP